MKLNNSTKPLKMVYYYTSGNVKMLKNIIFNFETTPDVSPYEYMKTYIEKCPDNIDDSKLAWIAETFLSIQKHEKFLKAIASHLSEQLSLQDQNYLIIVLHAVTFQIEPNNMQYLYKCIFNLSKTLLNTFTNFLSNNEMLTTISQIAQSDYDTKYITEKIVSPLFAWQPYISEMAHNYAEYVKKIESRKIKPPVIPIQPNVLNRKPKEPAPVVTQPSLPVTPPNSLGTKSKRVLTRSAIDRKLKHVHEQNKQRASNLLHNVKNREFHFAQVKSDKYYRRMSEIKNEIESSPKPLQKFRQFPLKNTVPQVKETNATVKRMRKRIQITEQEEVQWLQNVVNNCRNTAKIEEIEEQDRQERERERLLDIEKKHLMGQISHEEALLAKKKLLEENKKKYGEFLKEKESWSEEIEKWKKHQMEKNNKHIERLSLIELNLLEAKNEIANKRKENVETLKKESELMRAKAMKAKQEELERKINMIKEIKILAMIAKKARIPKIIDLTETSGVGLLCEMSMAELQERINGMKINLKEELDNKKKIIKEEKVASKREMNESKELIKSFVKERADIRKQNKKSNVNRVNPSQEIEDLKKILEEKRRLRKKLSMQ